MSMTKKLQRRRIMERPRIRHIAINVKPELKEQLADYYKKNFGMVEKGERSATGGIFLTDGFVCLALITVPNDPRGWGINHFGFQVESIKDIEEATGSVAVPNAPGTGRHGEFGIRDMSGQRVDISVHGWPY
jgi:hypothetical protein